MSKDKKRKSPFVEGPVQPEFIGNVIAGHSTKTNGGAHSIFLGQVRNDEINGQEVAAIEYTAYKEMADETYFRIREEIFEKYPLICMHVYHSIGSVNAGEISLFVMTTSEHRKEAIAACNEMVEKIKAELPVWGKEIFTNNEYTWKENK